MEAGGQNIEAVRVLVGQEQLLVPTGRLQSIVEYRLFSDVPFLHRWAWGVGTFENTLFPVARIGRVGEVAGPDDVRRVRRGLLLRVDRARFLMDVDRVVGFGRCRLVGSSTFSTWAGHLPAGWLVDGATEEREVLPTVDTEVVMGTLHA